MLAVIMAGGKGTRLLSLTKDEIPKPMVPLLGKPILQWQIECLKRNGITEVIIIVGHLGHRVKEYFKNGDAFGLSIRYIEETQPLGTAGALFYLREFLVEQPVLLVFGDVLFDIDLNRMSEFHLVRNAEVTLFVHPNAHPYDSDLVVVDGNGKVECFNSKSNDRSAYWYDNCVNAGLYMLQPAFFNRIIKPEKLDLEKEILTGMATGGENIYAYRSPEYVKDVGTPERIEAAEKELKSGLVVARNLKNKQKAVFLDRDGTINVYNGLICCEEDFELYPFAAEAIGELNRSGYLTVVITNQPVVARGLCGVADVENIHKKMTTLLGRQGVFLDDVKFCPHHPDRGFPEENPAYKISCRCRKPDTGMIEECVDKYNIDLSQSWFVGDTTMDIRTGKNAGMKTALVLTGEAGKDVKYPDEPDLICADLTEAVKKILEL